MIIRCTTDGNYASCFVQIGQAYIQRINVILSLWVCSESVLVCICVFWQVCTVLQMSTYGTSSTLSSTDTHHDWWPCTGRRLHARARQLRRCVTSWGFMISRWVEDKHFIINKLLLCHMTTQSKCTNVHYQHHCLQYSNRSFAVSLPVLSHTLPLCLSLRYQFRAPLCLLLAVGLYRNPLDNP